MFISLGGQRREGKSCTSAKMLFLSGKRVPREFQSLAVGAYYHGGGASSRDGDILGRNEGRNGWHCCAATFKLSLQVILKVVSLVPMYGGKWSREEESQLLMFLFARSLLVLNEESSNAPSVSDRYKNSLGNLMLLSG
jgi:hypothetical protein